LRLSDPLAKGLARPDPQLGGDRIDRLPLRLVLVTRLDDEPDRTVLHLLRISLRHACHRTPSSRIGASGHAGAVQNHVRRPTRHPQTVPASPALLIPPSTLAREVGTRGPA